MKSPQRNSRGLRWWVAGYLVVMAAIVGAMFCARHSAVSQLASTKSISDWQAWREDVRKQQTQPGLVKRQVPNSEEPPALVLMRDFFAVLLFGALLFSSMLYWIIAWFAIGVLASR
jgi:hypothetical protein